MVALVLWTIYLFGAAYEFRDCYKYALEEGCEPHHGALIAGAVSLTWPLMIFAALILALRDALRGD